MKIITLLAALFLLTNQALAADPVVTVLNTATGENGPLQTTDYTFLDKDKPLKFVADIGSGDTYVVQGKAVSADSYVTIYSFTADEWKEIYVPRFWRVIRTVDGGSDGTVKVINVPNLPLVAH